MSTRVDFYLLKSPRLDGKLHLVCRLADKAFRLGNRVYIQTTDHNDAQQLDSLLWTFAQGSFVPHTVLAGDTEGLDAFPVVIGAEPPPAIFNDVLVSLTSEAPTYFSRFKRVVEAVADDENDRIMARERFRYYRDQGAQLETHDITGQ